MDMKTKGLGFADAVQIKPGDCVVIGSMIRRVEAVANALMDGMVFYGVVMATSPPLFKLDGLGWVSWMDCSVYAGRSVKELAQEALEIQNACNPLGLSKGYARALQELRWALEVEGKPNDTDAISFHAINRLWLDKLCDLARYNRSGGSDNMMEFIAAYDEVCRLAGALRCTVQVTPPTEVVHLTEEQTKGLMGGMTAEEKQRIVYGFETGGEGR